MLADIGHRGVVGDEPRETMITIEIVVGTPGQRSSAESEGNRRTARPVARGGGRVVGGHEKVARGTVIVGCAGC